MKHRGAWEPQQGSTVSTPSILTVTEKGDGSKYNWIKAKITIAETRCRLCYVLINIKTVKIKYCTYEM